MFIAGPAVVTGIGHGRGRLYVSMNTRAPICRAYFGPERIFAVTALPDRCMTSTAPAGVTGVAMVAGGMCLASSLSDGWGALQAIGITGGGIR